MYTPKRDDELPRSFHMGIPPPGITVSVCYVSWSKVNYKGKETSVFVSCFVFHLAKYISLGAFGSVVSVSCLESETVLGSL